MADATESPLWRKGGALPWTLAAGLTIVAIWLAQRGATTRAEAAMLRQQQAIAETALKNLSQQLEAERILSARQLAMLQEQMKAPTEVPHLQIAVLVPPQDNSRAALGVAVWDAAKQDGVLVLEKAPSIAAGQRLELWLFEQNENAAPIRAGVLNVGADGNARARFKPATRASAVAGIAVSREPVLGIAAQTKPSEIILRGTFGSR